METKQPTAYHRKKQPEVVRAKLLKATASILLTKGIPALTLDAVARNCAISKGGLLHHFPSKQALLNALFDDILSKLDIYMDAAIQKDPNPQGRFTRAYLSMNSNPQHTPHNQLFGVMTIAMSSDPKLRERWLTWFENRLAQAPQDDRNTTCWIVRFASDGLWLSDLTKTPKLSAQQRQAIIQQLTQMTYLPISAEEKIQ